jgi:hypothetical protein
MSDCKRRPVGEPCIVVLFKQLCFIDVTIKYHTGINCGRTCPTDLRPAGQLVFAGVIFHPDTGITVTHMSTLQHVTLTTLL